MKTYGEHIQDKRFLCLIARIQMKIYGEHIQDKRLQYQLPESGRKYMLNKSKKTSVPTC